MMGSSRPSDPTLAAASEVVALLRALGSGDVTAVAARIEQAGASALAAIEAAQARLTEAAAKHEETRRALAEREAAVIAGGAALAGETHKVELASAALAEAKQRHLQETAQLQTERHNVAATQQAVDDLRRELNAAHQARMQELDKAHAKLVADHQAQAAHAAAELEKREKESDRREAAIVKAAEDQAQRRADLEDMQAAAEDTASVAEGLKDEYDRKLAQLRSLVG